MSRSARRWWALLALLVGISFVQPAPAVAQVTQSDSAAVLLDAARDFASSGRAEVAEALYRLILQRFPTSSAAAEARALLEAIPTDVADSGSVELRVWMTLYGAWLGVAIPAAGGASDSEPYGIGLLLGGPTGFLAGRGLANALDLTAGQARAITFGGTWGTWQGGGWAEVFDFGVEQECTVFGVDEFCYDGEDSIEEVMTSMIVGGLTGIAVGTALSRRRTSPGTASVVNFASLWGTWFGVAGGALADLEGDDLLAAALVGGNVGLVSSALLAPGWNVSRSRARLVSIAGVLGGLGGVGIDMLVQPDDDETALAIPLIGSVLGLGIGIAATRPESGVAEAMLDGPDGALIGVANGRLAFGTPSLVPTLVPVDRPSRRTTRQPALRVELFRAAF